LLQTCAWCWASLALEPRPARQPDLHSLPDAPADRLSWVRLASRRAAV